MPFQIVLQEKSSSTRLKRIQRKVPKECKTMIQIRGCAHTIPRMHLDAYWPLESKHLPSILKQSNTIQHTLCPYIKRFAPTLRVSGRLVSFELPAKGGGTIFACGILLGRDADYGELDSLQSHSSQHHHRWIPSSCTSTCGASLG